MSWVAFPYLLFLLIFLMSNVGLTVVWVQMAKPLLLKFAVLCKKYFSIGTSAENFKEKEISTNGHSIDFIDAKCVSTITHL